MEGVTVFSPRRDSAAIVAAHRHHAQLALTLGARIRGLVTAAALQRTNAAETARLELWEWCREELVPHAKAEEGTLYKLARDYHPEAELLVAAMLDEHRLIADLVERVGMAEDAVHAVAAAGALEGVFTVHLIKENDQLLPLLARSPYVSLADVLTGMHALLSDGDRTELADGA